MIYDIVTAADKLKKCWCYVPHYVIPWARARFFSSDALTLTEEIVPANLDQPTVHTAEADVNSNKCIFPFD